MLVTIPTPQRINNRIKEEFYPLQKEELMKLYEAKLIKSAAYVHFALRLENPYCDRPVQIIPKEFALRWRIPEKSVYRAIARLKELGILNIRSGKVVIDWVQPGKQETEEVEEIAVNENPAPKIEDATSEPGSDARVVRSELREESGDSQNCDKILKVEKKFSEVRKNSQSCENRGLKPLSDIGSETLQTLQNFQTNQTKRLEKTFFQEEEQQPKEKLVQETVQQQKVKEEKNLVSKAIEVEEVPRDVVHKVTKIISDGGKKSADIPLDLKEKLEELEIPLDNQVKQAIANHDISQAYGAASHVENTWDSINNPRGVFLFQLPRQPIEKLGSRYNEQILNNIKAQNQAIEEERKDPEYQKRSKDVFAQIRAKLKEKKDK